MTLCHVISSYDDDNLLCADLQCWAFCPPGSLVSKSLIKAMQPFCISVVCGKDAVPRMSVGNVARLMDEMVTGFPFDLTSAPMYWGSSMSFAATALWYGKPAGLLLTAFVIAMYTGALGYEDPFTAGIYVKRDKEQKAKSEKSKEIPTTARRKEVRRTTEDGEDGCAQRRLRVEQENIDTPRKLCGSSELTRIDCIQHSATAFRYGTLSRTSCSI